MKKIITKKIPFEKMLFTLREKHTQQEMSNYLNISRDYYSRLEKANFNNFNKDMLDNLLRNLDNEYYFIYENNTPYICQDLEVIDNE